jgi:CSLREA domain-containing protein
LDIYVDRLDDEYNGCSLESCSLREAITLVNMSDIYDTIILPAGTIELGRVGAGEDANVSGDLDITRSVTIVGKGPGVSVVDANHLDRVFHIKDSGVAVLFEHLTITGGGNTLMGDGGGGVYVDQGTAVFLHCDITGNSAEGGAGGGGGVSAFAGAVLWIEDSSVRSNSADHAHQVGGGILAINGVSLHVIRSTISGNSAGLGAPAVWFVGTGAQLSDSTISGNSGGSPNYGSVFVSGDMSLEFCTLTDNAEPTIGLSGSGSVVTLGRNIVHGQCDDSGGSLTTLGGNIEIPGDTCGLSPSIDLVSSANPELGPLGRFGGLTETHRPSPTSVVVDLAFPPGVPDCTRPDQRGFSRPADGSGDGMSRCDSGAVELIHGELFMDGFECGSTGSWSTAAP